jgi:biotin transport system substrate-specific component
MMSRRNEVTDFVYAALFAALIAVLGLVSIPLPISPVPVTGQSLAIMLAGSILTVRQAAFSVLTFLLIGAVGVPVFAGLTGGIGILVGPRGGYLLGFLVGAIVIALLKGQNNNKWRLVFANMVGGIVVVYAFGVVWLNFVTGMGLEKAFMVGVLPYIPGDLFKVFVATVIGIAVNKQLPKIGLRS